MASLTLLVALSGALFPSATAFSPDSQCDWPAQHPQHLLAADPPAACSPDTFYDVQNSEPYAEWIWSRPPFCASGTVRDYCTHTNKHFYGGNGLSIIATPKAAEAASRAFEFARKTPVRSGKDDRLEVRDIPGKGKGLVAKKRIRKGERILLDSPRIIASSQLPMHVGPSDGLDLFNAAVKMLPKKDQDAVMALEKSMGGSGVDDILKTNSFACQIDDDGVEDSYLCLFPSVARINHACRPNAHAKFIPKTLLMEIKALRDITPEEEISISYGKVDLQHAERQKLYKEGWGFTCTCSLCTADIYAIKGSDQRRTRFSQLHSQLNSLTAETYDAQQIMAWEKEVFQISEKEGLDILIAEDYERMAYVHAGLGKLREARKWATKAKESLVEWTFVEGGANNELKRVEELLGELGG